MSDTRSTGQEPVTVNVIASARPHPEFDPWYLATPEGGIRTAETVLSFVTFVCIVLVHGAFEGTYVATFVSIIAFLASLILLIMYLFNLVQLTSDIDWVKWETVYTGLWSVLFLVSAIIMTYSAVNWKTYAAAWGTSAFFAFICTGLFIGDFVITLKQYRRRNAPPEQPAYSPGQQQPQPRKLYLS